MAKKRRSAFVPRIIFGTVFVGVVPAVATCGGDDTSSGGQSGTILHGVAAGGFSVAGGGFFGVGVGGFGGVAAGGFGGVAEGGFGGSGNRDAAANDAADAADARGAGGGSVDAGRRDAFIAGVAAGGFGVAKAAFEVLPPKAGRSSR